MTDNLQQLADWAEPLLASLEPKERRQLSRKIAIDLRRSQQKRIAAQKNPDGTDYVPRKPQHRAKAGAIRRQVMFTGIRKAKYLKTRGHADTATVGYTNQAVARIARIHQYGLTAKVDKNGPKYDYPARELLGFTQDDVNQIRDQIIDHLASGR